MGKTVPSFRMALEFEIERWKGFRKALTGKENREAFEELMDMYRSLAMAGGNAADPILFEPMVMSIFVAQQKRILEIEAELSAIYAKRLGLPVIEQT